jgi:hypothetical protein
MTHETRARPDHYRVWIAACRDGRPQDCRKVPEDAVAVGPAEPGTMSAAEADKYVEAYNQASRSRRTPTWAVAVPVTVRYKGEPRPGQQITEVGTDPRLSVTPKPAEPRPEVDT